MKRLLVTLLTILGFQSTAWTSNLSPIDMAFIAKVNGNIVKADGRIDVRHGEHTPATYLQNSVLWFSHQIT